MALPKFFKLSKEVQAAQRKGQPVVALESTVITHGLPQPANLEIALAMEDIVRADGAVPATIGVLDGRLLVGMDADELEALATAKDARKLSSRDLGDAIAAKHSGGTTVAGTLRAAGMVGIPVFATGGIGGVHRGSERDVSADLGELARQPVVVVCAGAKAILDLPATLEELETLGVPVIGYQTEEFPAFYSRQSGLGTSGRAENAKEAAEIAMAHWQLGGGGLLLATPVPEEDALPSNEVEAWIERALGEAKRQKLSGQAVTPFLLKRISELSGGKSLQANLALLKNNAQVATEVASHMQAKPGPFGLVPGTKEI